ncbi:Pyrid_oxidase_2 domain-containing protein, partial [Cephalotus follicularis]
AGPTCGPGLTKNISPDHTSFYKYPAHTETLYASLSLSLSLSPMESLSSSLLTSSNFTETYPVHSYLSSSLINAPNTNNKPIESLKFPGSFHHVGLRVQASLAREVAGEDEPTHSNIGLVYGDNISSSKGNSDDIRSTGKHADEISKVETSLVVPHGSGTGGGTRAGLFRTPISGGVQSATSAHGLPLPALAVRNLMEQARFAHLCTVMSRMHHRREGYPFGSLVDFAPDSMGHPLFSFSPLAIHTRNLLADPRCTLVVQIPGWSGLSNARVTIFGDVFPLPEHQQEWAHKQYVAKHQQGPSQQWGNFYYFRMQNISDIYFIGGFGTVAWVDVKEYEAIKPDKIAVDGGEQNLKELNAMFSKPLKELLSAETEIDDAALISIDSKGTDVRVRQGAQFNIQRISFEEGHGVETLEEAKAALWKLIEKGQVHNLQK